MLDKSKLKKRKIEILEFIQRFKTELKEIIDDYTTSNDAVLSIHRFRRWYHRTYKILSKQFPLGEDTKFEFSISSQISKISDPHKRLASSINGYKSYLQALEEDIEKHPQDFFSNDDSLKKRDLNLDKELKWGDLRLNFSFAKLKYKNYEEIDVGLETDPIKLLILLMKRQGEVIHYLKIAEECQLSCFNNNATDKSVSPEVQNVRRDLINELKKAGMSQEEASLMIKSVTNVGYKLIKPEKDLQS